MPPGRQAARPLLFNACMMALIDIHCLSFWFCILFYLISYSVHAQCSGACPMFFIMFMYLGRGVCWPGHPSAMYTYNIILLATIYLQWAQKPLQCFRVWDWLRCN